MARKSATQKRIEHFGFDIQLIRSGLKATKGSGKQRLVLYADTLSDLRFFIRFEKFYRGELPIPENFNWYKKIGWSK